MYMIQQANMSMATGDYVQAKKDLDAAAEGLTEGPVTRAAYDTAVTALATRTLEYGIGLYESEMYTDALELLELAEGETKRLYFVAMSYFCLKNYFQAVPLLDRVRKCDDLPAGEKCVATLCLCLVYSTLSKQYAPTSPIGTATRRLATKRCALVHRLYEALDPAQQTLPEDVQRKLDEMFS
ncbi:MAG: hypothetical protein SP1CHLAM54_01240 [Chlamydiia bacterium]|nr:hypothetical protein [Chlamydiia bacterium]